MLGRLPRLPKKLFGFLDFQQDAALRSTQIYLHIDVTGLQASHWSNDAHHGVSAVVPSLLTVVGYRIVDDDGKSQQGGGKLGSGCIILTCTLPYPSKTTTASASQILTAT